jgi:hypothetical protein
LQGGEEGKGNFLSRLIIPAIVKYNNLIGPAAQPTPRLQPGLFYLHILMLDAAMLNEWSDRDPDPKRPSGPRNFLFGGLLTLILVAMAINFLSGIL